MIQMKEIVNFKKEVIVEEPNIKEMDMLILNVSLYSYFEKEKKRKERKKERKKEQRKK